MRTLKKVLALSLVFAMAFTMMAGAAFKDQDKIDSSLTNDIQLLTALGVFKGDENGNFNPTDNVKRSEAAKMIYVLKNNGVDDGAVAFQGVSKYSDVPVGHWAEGYINYCTNLGYMGGWQENGVQKFDPNGNVTGVEMMKMLLCMIGYKSDIQGYTGNGWQTNVLVDAAVSGLSVEFVPSVYAATPRQWTARLMTNAINAPYVSYNRGELQFGSALDSTMSYGEQYLGLEIAMGQLTETKTMKYDATSATNVVKGTNSDNVAKIAVVSGVTNTEAGDVDFDVSADLLGEIVNVYYKKGSTTASTTTASTTTADKIYAVLPARSAVYNTTLGDVKVDGTKISFEGYAEKDYDQKTITVYENFVKNTSTSVQITADTQLKNIGFGTNNNSAVKLVDVDNDGFIDSAFITKSTFAIVKDIDVAKTKLTLKNAAGTNVYLQKDGTVSNGSTGSADLTFNSSNAEDWKYLNLAEGLAADDVVRITPNYTSGKVVFDIVKADSFTGTVSGYKTGDPYSGSHYHYAEITVDGTSYKVGAIDSTTNETVMKGYKASDEDAVQLKDAKNFYTDGKYVIYATGEASTFSTNLAYVIEVMIEGTWNNGKVKVLTADGVQTLTYVAETDLPSSAKKTSELVKGTVYEYVMDGDRVYMKDLKDTGKTTTGTSSDALVYDKANKQVTINDGGSVKALNADDTLYFVKYQDNGDKYITIKGSELTYGVNGSSSNVSTGKQFAYSTATGMPVMVFGVLDFASNLPSAVTTGKYAVVTGTAGISGEIDKNNYKVTLPVAGVDGTELTFKIAKDDALEKMSDLNGFKNQLVSYELSGEYVDIDSITQVTGTTTQGDGDWAAISVGNATDSVIYGVASDDTTAMYYTVNSDTKYIYITKSSSTADAAVAEDGSVSKAAEDDNLNAIVLAGVDDTTVLAKVVVVEVDGNDISDIIA